VADDAFSVTIVRPHGVSPGTREASIEASPACKINGGRRRKNCERRLLHQQPTRSHMSQRLAERLLPVSSSPVRAHTSWASLVEPPRKYTFSLSLCRRARLLPSLFKLPQSGGQRAAPNKWPPPRSPFFFFPPPYQCGTTCLGHQLQSSRGALGFKGLISTTRASQVVTLIKEVREVNRGAWWGGRKR
jgi:hypothetical protein